VTTPDETPAKQRFWLLQALRLGGLGVAGGGAWMWRDAANVGTDGIAGRALVVFGLFLALIVPALLARQWRRRG
jgi:hypothetical protein